MKKIFLFLLFLPILALILLSGPTKVQATTGNINYDPSSGSGRVGQTIKFTFDIQNMSLSTLRIWLYIYDAPPKEKDIYLKETYYPPKFSEKNSETYTYNWDTVASQSNPGVHKVQVIAEINDLDIGVRNETWIDTTYNLLPASTTGETGDTGRDEPPKDDTVETNTDTGNAFDLGKLGKISFLPTKVNDAKELIVVIINWLLSLMGALAIIALVYSGIMYITAGADAAKAETAKKNLMWAIIGVVVILLALVIVSFVSKSLSG